MLKIPRLNLNYWLLMLLCTTMGELIGNLLSRNLELGYTKGAVLDVIIFTFTIAACLALNLKNEIFYWILILMGNIGGTNLADWVTLEPLANDKTWGFLQPLELGTKIGSLAVMMSLIVVLILRYVFAKRLGDRSIVVSICYWFAILLSSTFGTTSGDLITNDTPLGALGGSIVLFLTLILVYLGYRRKIVGAAPAYRSALVLVHPIGATFGNWVSKPIGLNLGNIYTNVTMIILFALIYIFDGRAKASADYETEPRIGLT